MASSQFEGWLGVDKSAAKGNMQWGKFEPKKWTEDDVDIEVSHCGVCGSDLHMLSSGWGPTPYRELRDTTYNASMLTQTSLCRRPRDHWKGRTSRLQRKAREERRQSRCWRAGKELPAEELPGLQLPS
jgi:hypothetical protein